MRSKIKHCRHRFEECTLIAAPCPHDPEEYSSRCPSFEEHLKRLIEQEAEA